MRSQRAPACETDRRAPREFCCCRRRRASNRAATRSSCGVVLNRETHQWYKPSTRTLAPETDSPDETNFERRQFLAESFPPRPPALPREMQKDCCHSLSAVTSSRGAQSATPPAKPCRGLHRRQ